MLDPKLIRENPDLVRAAIARKHLEVDLDAVLALDQAWRTLLQEVELLRGRQKARDFHLFVAARTAPFHSGCYPGALCSWTRQV